MSEWQRAQVEINQHQISYLRTGGEKRSIILLHGFTEDSSTWQEVAKALAPNYDLIMPDTIGHGESSRLPADGAIDPLQDLTVFIDALGLQKTAIIGHSMGEAVPKEGQRSLLWDRRIEIRGDLKGKQKIGMLLGCQFLHIVGYADQTELRFDLL